MAKSKIQYENDTKTVNLVLLELNQMLNDESKAEIQGEALD